MKLGEKQLEWIKYLKDHPERAGNVHGVTGYLGILDVKFGWLLCCLGATCMIAYEQADTTPVKSRSRTLVNPSYTEGLKSDTGLHNYEEYGLRNSFGIFQTPIKIGEHEYVSLANMNDRNISWADIAAIMESEEHRDNIFTESK